MPSIIEAGKYTDVSKYSKDAYGYIKTPEKKVSFPKQVLKKEQDREELSRLREMSDNRIAGHRFQDQDNFKDKERQLGTPLHSTELVKRIRKINKNLTVEDSMNCRGHAAFYYHTPEGEKRYTNASFKKGILSEFSVIETDAADLPVRVQYGWREVLSRLLQARQLSLKAVLRMFGDAHTVQSQHWRRNVQRFRD